MTAVSKFYHKMFYNDIGRLLLPCVGCILHRKMMIAYCIGRKVPEKVTVVLCKSLSLIFHINSIIFRGGLFIMFYFIFVTLHS